MVETAAGEVGLDTAGGDDAAEVGLVAGEASATTGPSRLSKTSPDTAYAPGVPESGAGPAPKPGDGDGVPVNP